MEEKIAKMRLLMEVQNHLFEDAKLDDHVGAIIGIRAEVNQQEQDSLIELFYPASLASTHDPAYHKPPR